MTLLKLRALDTLFFRDGKPFSMGDETWADGIFPPPPSVIYGALRTAYLSENIAELANANTQDDKTKNLIINFCAFHSGDKFYYPCPLDVVEKKKQKDINKPEYTILNLEEKPENFYSSLGLSFLLQAEEQVEEASGLMSEISLREYLHKNKIPKTLKNNYLKEESKVGIGKNNLTNTSDEGMLYRVGMKRLANIGLAVGFSGVKITQNGLMRLGGEGKSVSFSSENSLPNIAMPEQLSEEYFKVYLATPAIFTEGWKPSDEKVSGAKLIAACIGKPLYIGGFDMKPKDGNKARPKPMRRAVPAGSVFYYKGSRECAEKLHATSISDYGSKQGFGIAYVGSVNK